jgi:hypothetical protein
VRGAHPDFVVEELMQDFTLVIPTYNRPKQLAALLSYLGVTRAPCRILVLDSSQPQSRLATRKIIEAANLRLDYVEFPSDTHPFDKFREGVHKVTTKFCASIDARCRSGSGSGSAKASAPGLSQGRFGRNGEPVPLGERSVSRSERSHSDDSTTYALLSTRQVLGRLHVVSTPYLMWSLAIMVAVHSEQAVRHQPQPGHRGVRASSSCACS